jgi:hypothetical protein
MQWGLIMAAPLVVGFLAIAWQVRKLVHTVIRIKNDETNREPAP